MIAAGLANPTQDVSKATVEAEAASKGRCSQNYYIYFFTLTRVKLIISHLLKLFLSFLMSHIYFQMPIKKQLTT